jgi:hypothetical protein
MKTLVSRLLLSVGVLCFTASSGAQTATVTVQPAPDKTVQHVVVQARYYASPGKSAEVYETRLRACDVLIKLGLHQGQVFRGRGGDEPDAIWQLDLDEASVAKERQTALENPEFLEVVKHMGTLIRRSELSTYREEHLMVNDKVNPKLNQNR